MNKTTMRFISLFFVLTVLVSGFYLLNFKKSSPEISKSIFSNIKKEQVGKMVLNSGQQTINLIKNNNAWALDGDKNVDQSKIETLVDLLLDINKDNLISNNKQNQPQFEIGSKKISFYVGKDTNTINIGKKSNLNMTYFSINESGETYVTNSDFDDFFTNDFYVLKDETATPPATINQ